MATFNVFVEGAIDDSPTALPELAEAMSSRYGLAPNDLVSRLRRGRFRVKSNVDAPTAERYKRDLEAIGARVLVEDSAISPTATPVAGTPVTRPSNVSLPPVNARPSTPPPTRTATPATGLAAAGPQHARPSTPPPNRPSASPSVATSSALAGMATPAHQRPSTPIPSDMASGLSAAFGEASAEQDLGALGGIGDGALSLASLDGEEDHAGANQSFDAPPEPTASVTFAPPKPKTTTEPPKPKPAAASQPMDLFAPPDAGDQGFAVEFATDVEEERARKKASAPPENTSATPASKSQPMATRRTPVSMDVVAVAPAEFDRKRFALGVLLALVIGFLPAHFIGKMREKSAYDAIDQRVAQVHASADTHETWMALDGARAKLLEEKESKRTMIGLTSVLIWAVVAAGVAFAFSRVPTERKKTAA